MRIAGFYYETLPAYMQDIFALTQRAVGGDEEGVALQALEFWCTVCEEEIELEEVRRGEAGRAGEGGACCCRVLVLSLWGRDILIQPASQPARQAGACHAWVLTPGAPARPQDEDEGAGGAVNHRFIAAALPHLVPLLLAQLTKQEEGQEAEDGAWNLAMAGGTCLGLCACAAGDAVVPLVMPFVQENIQRAGGGEEWRQREAATFAFGSILEGPGVATLAQVAHSGLGFLLAALKDPNPAVKNTTAWTIGRMFEFVHGADGAPPLITPANLAQAVGVLLEAIQDQPHIAEKVGGARLWGGGWWGRGRAYPSCMRQRLQQRRGVSQSSLTPLTSLSSPPPSRPPRCATR